ncbi:MAG: DUF3638 domain-containing protein, partial [Gammaproteobacteria bacterium]|nr:DUF3638 domain-containing protein [Gammaproteobacteria bacterium]
KKQPNINYYSVRVNKVEKEVITDITGRRFHFQRNTKGQPQVFFTEIINGLENSENECDFYQKIPVDSFKNAELCAVLKENPNYTMWMNTKNNNQVYVLDKDLKTCLSIDLYQKKLIVLETGYQLILKEQLIHRSNFPLLYIQLKQFAGNHFKVYQHPETGALKVEIPGNQISFSLKTKEEGLIFSAEPTLRLNIESRLDFPGAMTLSDEKNNHYLLFPDLPYMASNKEGYFIKSVPDYDLHTFKKTRDQSESLFQHFENKRNYFNIKVDQKGQPQPHSIDEKLFLCYYYLNNKRYDKALSGMQALLKEESLENNFSLFELLHRIISESPKKTHSESATPFSESILAIKIRSILLAAKIKISQKMNWPKEATGFTDFAKGEEVKNFFETFPNKECAELINSYVRHISQGVYPESWRITDDELRILIDFNLSEKLNQNKQIFQWKGISALKSKSAPFDLFANAMEMAASSKKLINSSEGFIKDYEKYYIFDMEDKSHLQKDWKVNVEELTEEKLSESKLLEEKPSEEEPSIVQLSKEKLAQTKLPKEKLSKEIASAERKIHAEKLEQKSLIKKGHLFLKNATDFKDQLALQITLLTKQTDLKENLLNFCHRLQESNLSIKHAIESHDMTVISFEDLITAYLRNHPKELAQKLGIPEADPTLSHIFTTLENILKQSVQLGRLQKIQELYQRIAKSPANDEDVLQCMKSIREFESAYQLTEKNRELLVFEYYEQKRLRAEQINVIEHILQPGNENSGVQFKMGGGKTSTLLPLAAIKNADGNALSMIIVPDAMLAVNAKQLDLSTYRFSSRSMSLHFSRDTEVTPDSLLRILNSLKATQKQYNYIVTSRETLQALELKYIELLSKREDPTSINLMKEILLLFREKGKAIIDEIDTVLDVRKEFNYSNGDAVPLKTMYISDTLDLYRILNSLTQRKPTTENIHEVMAKLLNKMKQEKGFVFDVMQRFPNTNITGYLLGFVVENDFLSQLPQDEKDRIALLKYQLTTLLPATLLQELHVNYGASKQDAEKISDIPHNKRLYAIPYLCNNIPAEDSQFSSPFETLNLTIQMHLASPLNKSILEKMLKDFYVEHFNEAVENSTMSAASKKFKTLIGLDLETVYKQFMKEGNLDAVLIYLESHPH